MAAPKQNLIKQEEVWKKINDRYAVSSFGNVKSLDLRGLDSRGRTKFKKGVMLSLNGLRNGYPVVNITGYGNRKQHKVHQLVAKFFIPNPDNLPCINHKDGNKQNNHVENLEWCTQQYNCLHAFRVLKRDVVRNVGSSNGFAKKVLDTKDGIIYGSLAEAANKLYPTVKYSTIRAMLSGQNPNSTTLKYL